MDELQVLAAEIVKTIEEEDEFYDAINGKGFKQVTKAKNFLDKYWGRLND